MRTWLRSPNEQQNDTKYYSFSFYLPLWLRSPVGGWGSSIPFTRLVNVFRNSSYDCSWLLINWSRMLLLSSCSPMLHTLTVQRGQLLLQEKGKSWRYLEAENKWTEEESLTHIDERQNVNVFLSCEALISSEGLYTTFAPKTQVDIVILSAKGECDHLHPEFMSLGIMGTEVPFSLGGGSFPLILSCSVLQPCLLCLALKTGTPAHSNLRLNPPFPPFRRCTARCAIKATHPRFWDKSRWCVCVRWVPRTGRVWWNKSAMQGGEKNQCWELKESLRGFSGLESSTLQSHSNHFPACLHHFTRVQGN